MKDFTKRTNDPNSLFYRSANALSGHSRKMIFELFSLQNTGTVRHHLQQKPYAFMELQTIEQSAFDEMKTLITTLRERAERLHEIISPPQRWLP